jgi:small subunit ribosomal protein S15
VKAILYLKMARTHARVKGKSGSKRPVHKDVSFVTLKPKEIEQLIVDMAKNEGLLPSKIGLILRDKYAIPSVKVVCGSSITEILRKNGVESEIPEDLHFLVTKALALRKHLETNTRDTHNTRGLQLIDAKIRRLSTYYKKKGILAKKWSYN